MTSESIFLEKGENVQDTGMTFRNLGGGVSRIYRNDLSNTAKGQAEFGGAIYSDSFDGATMLGAGEAVRKYGQSVDNVIFEFGEDAPESIKRLMADG